jgi:Holliday junction resolvasome RuvABC endonuclease subunit
VSRFWDAQIAAYCDANALRYQKETMIVAGIDPSLSCTAVCIGDAERHDMHAFKSAPEGRRLVERTRRFEDHVAKIMQPLEVLGVDVICIEGYAHMANTGHQHALAEFGGILRFHLIELTDAVYEVAPMTLKKFCAGKAGPGKAGVISALTRDYGVGFPTDDCFDAFGLFRMALVLGGGAEPRTRAQREAIDTVLGLEQAKKAERSEKRVQRLLTEELPF